MKKLTTADKIRLLEVAAEKWKALATNPGARPSKGYRCNLCLAVANTCERCPMFGKWSALDADGGPVRDCFHLLAPYFAFSVAVELNDEPARKRAAERLLADLQRELNRLREEVPE